MSAIWKRVKPWCIPAGLPLLVFILLRYVFLIGYVPTESMEPTLPKGSFLLGLRIFEEPKVGDIIVFEKDGGRFWYYFPASEIARIRIPAASMARQRYCFF